MYNAAVRLLLLLTPIKTVDVPPANTGFWIANTGQKMITNNGNRIVFKPGMSRKENGEKIKTNNQIN